MVDILVTETLRAQGTDEAAAIIRASCEPLPDISAGDASRLRTLRDSVGSLMMRLEARPRPGETTDKLCARPERSRWHQSD